MWVQLGHQTAWPRWLGVNRVQIPTSFPLASAILTAFVHMFGQAEAFGMWPVFKSSQRLQRPSGVVSMIEILLCPKLQWFLWTWPNTRILHECFLNFSTLLILMPRLSTNSPDSYCLSLWFSACLWPHVACLSKVSSSTDMIKPEKWHTPVSFTLLLCRWAAGVC